MSPAASAREADAFAANVLPLIISVQSAGITSLRGIANTLNTRATRTARVGEWTVVQVKRVLDRAREVQSGGRIRAQTRPIARVK